MPNVSYVHIQQPCAAIISTALKNKQTLFYTSDDVKFQMKKVAKINLYYSQSCTQITIMLIFKMLPWFFFFSFSFNASANRWLIEITTWSPPDHRKEMKTEVVCTCLLLIRSGKNHRARHSERRKKTSRTKKQKNKRGDKTSSRNGQAWNSPSPGGQWGMEKNGENWLWGLLWCPNDPCC